MAFSSHALSPSDTTLVASKAQNLAQKAPRKGFFTRLFVAMQEARIRAAEKEIARYLHLAGGITDSTEREIERRFLGHPRTYL